MPDKPQPRLVPHSREAEEAILGAILINPNSYYDVAEVLQASDFYIHRHRFIWEAITRMQERRTPVDFLTLTEELDQAGKLSEIGGAVYLSGLINQVPTSLHAQAYAQIIAQAAVRRRLVDAAHQVVKLAFAEGESIEKVIDESEKAILSINNKCLRSKFQPLSEVLISMYDQVTACSQQASSPGIPTGFAGLDFLLQGMQPSDLLIVAGRPGMGKTSLLLSIARQVAKVHQKHIAILTLETSRVQLAQRLVAQEIGIEAQRIRSGRLVADEWQSLTHGIESLSNAYLFLDDTPAATIQHMRSKCRSLHMENRLDLVVVDYLQLLSGGERFENRVQEVTYITRQLKVMASELNVPVLAAAQLSRAVEQRADKRPVLSDLRESGSIEMDADVVMFLHRLEGPEISDHVEIIVAKHRNGPTGSVRLAFRKSLAMFENGIRKGDM
jgi:replicative DNA helicase